MNFTEAFEEMEQGKKVRRKWWGSHEFVRIVGGCTQGNDNKVYDFTFADIKAEDWETYHPEPVPNPCGCGGRAEIEVLTGVNEAQYVKAICQSCGNQTTECETREEAIEEWNTAHPIAEPKKRTNFDKVFLPWVNRNTAEYGLCSFKEYGLCSFKEEFVIGDCSCNDISCKECNERFIEYLQQEYKEVKE